MPKLIINERGKEHERHYEWNGERISLGRHESNAILLHAPGISRRHAELSADSTNFFLTDLGSGNGTELNGKPIKSNEPHLIKQGDIFTIDTFDIRVLTTDKNTSVPDDEVTESDILEVKLLKKVLSALDRETAPSLEVLNGSEEGKKIFLTDDVTELTIGRDPECGFAVAEHVISRRHAKIIKRWGGIVIRDLESKNGTFINNRRVVEEYLHDGDRLALGTIVMMFRNPQEVNVAEFEPPPPRRQPPKVTPKDIPLVDETGPAIPAPKATEPTPKEEEKSALKEWDELEKSLPGVPYPKPKPPAASFKRLTPAEIGMIGLGSLVLVFAVMTLVNLLLS